MHSTATAPVSPWPALPWRAWPVAVGALLAALCTLLIVGSSLPYVTPDGVHPFLDERPALTAWWPWRIALGVHAASGIVCLPLGLALLWPRAARARRAHALLGRLYALIFATTLLPTGLFLGVYAKGGWSTAPGFIGSGLLSAACLVIAIQRVRDGDLVGHRAFMVRSVAQIASAITFRIAHLALQTAAARGWDLSHEVIYAASLWLSVLGNAALAEVYLYRRFGGRSPWLRFHPEPPARQGVS